MNNFDGYLMDPNPPRLFDTEPSYYAKKVLDAAPHPAGWAVHEQTVKQMQQSLPTGFSELDKLSGGVRMGELLVFAGSRTGPRMNCGPMVINQLKKRDPDYCVQGFTIDLEMGRITDIEP